MQNYVEECNVCLMFKVMIWSKKIPAGVRLYIRLRSYNCVSLRILFFSPLTWHQNPVPPSPPSPIRSLFFSNFECTHYILSFMLLRNSWKTNSVYLRHPETFLTTDSHTWAVHWEPSVAPGRLHMMVVQMAMVMVRRAMVKVRVAIRGGNWLHSQLPSECDYLQSTRSAGDCVADCHLWW